MKKRGIVWIIVTVVLLHGVLFLVIWDKKPLPKRPHIARPTFWGATLETIDEATGDKLTYRQFTVRTKLTPSGEPPTLEPEK